MNARYPILATAVFALLGAPPAYAAQIDGPPGPDNLIGTSSNDEIRGFGGDDFIDGKLGNDDLRGGDQSDMIEGGGGGFMALAPLPSTSAATDPRSELLGRELWGRMDPSFPVGRLALSRKAYRRLWERFRLETRRPRVNLKRRGVLFAGIWEPKTCYWEYRGLSLERRPATFSIAVEYLGEGCLPALAFQTMAISIRRPDVPRGRLFARFATQEESFRVKRGGRRFKRP